VLCPCTARYASPPAAAARKVTAPEKATRHGSALLSTMKAEETAAVSAAAPGGSSTIAASSTETRAGPAGFSRFIGSLIVSISRTWSASSTTKGARGTCVQSVCGSTRAAVSAAAAMTAAEKYRALFGIGSSSPARPAAPIGLPAKPTEPGRRKGA
jgi:hypothetical protein